ncbi:biotin/lipoyl-containing protein [Accumulibacter sp.]|uniref:biotin/lipoyl-containing protein n=1 Tax=Accumulibacter sp. TaxID=2053492 RepID=UPI0025D120DF|nr:biotin/lipoyl-containing protein [Accumulibacter sp.]MCM8596845.1 acetyl-CoA carboxylase biotin carboxyl carrier protein subunit [Accumulibacter sp.]MCM8624621.1 acetyl-CoA carboxylase biotin carboxyl carrier protein subunit [Accumulibacter sp.]MDS4050993.1 biotin/lipoyl-containing protein [Accumulibacter sp.]
MPRKFKVTVNGREYDVSVLEIGGGQTQQGASQPTAGPAVAAPVAAATTASPAPAAASTPAAGAGDIVAAMGGVIVEVDVKVGQSVAVGDRLVVIEAMKMKTPITSTRAGEVTRVLVSPGDAVEGGQALVTIA